MKIFKYLAIAIVTLVSLGAISGCKGADYPYDHPEKLEANTTAVTISAYGGVANVILDVNRDWASKVKFKGESKNWLIVTPDKGAATVNTTPIQLSADTNDGKDREADVIISIGSKTLTIVVTQRGIEGE
jgi:hypothetical protein